MWRRQRTARRARFCRPQGEAAACWPASISHWQLLRDYRLSSCDLCKWHASLLVWVRLCGLLTACRVFSRTNSCSECIAPTLTLHAAAIAWRRCTTTTRTRTCSCTSHTVERTCSALRMDLALRLSEMLNRVVHRMHGSLYAGFCLCSAVSSSYYQNGWPKPVCCCSYDAPTYTRNSLGASGVGEGDTYDQFVSSLLTNLNSGWLWPFCTRLDLWDPRFPWTELSARIYIALVCSVGEASLAVLAHLRTLSTRLVDAC